MKHHLIALALTVLASAALAGPNHSHEKIEAGPNGGRLITSVEPHAEILVTADRSVRVTFLTDDGKTVSPEGKAVTLTTGERSAPVKISFRVAGDVLVSDQPLPAGDNLPAVFQVRTGPDAKPVVEKFHLNLAKCPTCKNQEYACTCHH